MTEDEPPRRRATRLETPLLDSWGVAELEAYIAALRAEIARAEAAIAARNRQRHEAEAVFGRRSQ